MTKSKLIALVAGITLLVAGGAGAGFWWWQGRDAHAAKAPPPPKPSTFRYVTLGKVIVMLRSQAGDPLAHYMAVDVVFKANDPVKEKAVKDQLPLLRSVTVKALSAYTLDKASALTIEQLAPEVNDAYKSRYTEDGIEQPFDEALISKLIIE